VTTRKSARHNIKKLHGKLFKGEIIARTRFSVANLTVFALIFAGIGSYVIFHSSAAGTIRYVSPSGSGSTCSQASPCSLSTGQSQAVPGDTVMLLNGSYGSFEATKAGTASAPIKFQALNHWGAKFSGVALNNSYIDWVGTEVTNPGVACNSGSSGIWATNGNDANGIGYSSHNDRIIGNWIHNIGVSGNGPAPSGCRDGGAIYISSPDMSVINNVIEHAVSDCVSSWHSPDRMIVVNNTIADCGGGGINTATTGDYVANNIVVDAALGKLYSNGSGNTYVNNLVFGNGPNTAGLGSDSNTGMVVADPLFVSSTDRHLQSGSPAINSGTSNSAPATDVENNARPQGAGYDRGAYEFGSGVTPPPSPTPDTTPPAPPTNLAEGAPPSCTTACLIPMSWTAATDNVGVDHYDDYNDGVLVGSVSGSTTAADWGGSGTGTCETHSIGLVAVDAAGNRSTMASISATTYCLSAAKVGDLNSDNTVNIFDLSILLSNYNKTKAQSSNPGCDLNNDNIVNIFDLSILLSHYGT
jgi:hypothetical protein